MNHQPIGLPPLPTIEWVILNALIASPKPMYSLELITASEGWLKWGTMHITLQRMERKGFVESEMERPAPEIKRRRRRLYLVTEIGTRVARAYAAASTIYGRWLGGGRMENREKVEVEDTMLPSKPSFCPNCGSIQSSWLRAITHHSREPETCTALRKQFEEGKGN